VVEVRHVGDTLYFTAGNATCPSTLYSAPANGGAPTPELKADPGFEITGFSVTAAGRPVYFESGCGSNAGTGKLVFPAFGHGPGEHTVTFASLPPVIDGDPVWESDSQHADAFVRTGMEGYLARFDSQHGNKTMPSANACPGFDVNNGMPGALTTAPDGTLWFAVQTGTSMQVLSCSGGTPTVETTVTKTNDTPASLSVDAAGDVLLADAAGHVWNVTAGGGEAAISNGSPFTSVTW
jgi:hypothetical protein